MFLINPAQVVVAEVFSRMPAEHRRTGWRSSWADANRGGHPVDSFLEGPVIAPNGDLYVADIPFGRIFKIDTQGDWELIVEYDGEPNGMKFADADTLVITDYRNGLMRLDLGTRRVVPLLDRRNSERFKGVNDLVFDSAGNLFFTDQGQTGLQDPTGRLFRLSPEGRLDMLLGNVPSPNGVALSPDERLIYLAVTRGNQVWRVPLQQDGSVSKVSAFFTSHGPSGPDGLAVDEEGNILVANPGLGCVWVLNGRAEPVRVVCSPEGASLTNLAFGGKDRRRVFCTESLSGSILTFAHDAPGLKLARARHGMFGVQQ